MKKTLALLVMSLTSGGAWAVAPGYCSASRNGTILDTQQILERSVLAVSDDKIIVVDSDEVSTNLTIWSSSTEAFYRNPSPTSSSDSAILRTQQDSDSSVTIEGLTVTCRPLKTSHR